MTNPVHRPAAERGRSDASRTAPRPGMIGSGMPAPNLKNPLDGATRARSRTRLLVPLTLPLMAAGLALAWINAGHDADDEISRPVANSSPSKQAPFSVQGAWRDLHRFARPDETYPDTTTALNALDSSPSPMAVVPSPALSPASETLQSSHPDPEVDAKAPAGSSPAVTFASGEPIEGKIIGAVDAVNPLDVATTDAVPTPPTPPGPQTSAPDALPPVHTEPQAAIEPLPAAASGQPQRAPRPGKSATAAVDRVAPKPSYQAADASARLRRRPLAANRRPAARADLAPAPTDAEAPIATVFQGWNRIMP